MEGRCAREYGTADRRPAHAPDVYEFELVIEWRHLKSAGNSGVFVWVPDQALAQLKPGVLPEFGIEVQMLDHGFRSSTRRSRQKGRLVHHPRRHLRRRQVEAQAVPAALAERLAQFPAQGTEPGRGRVEPLLRARDQRRAAAVGQRRRGVRRQRRRTAHAAISVWRPKDRRWNSGTSACARCPDRLTAVTGALVS